MQTIKLHEATKQFGISNKLAMFFLEKKNMPVKSHSSVISIDQLESLREFSAKQDNFPSIINEFNRIEKEKKKARKAKSAAPTEPEKVPEKAPEPPEPAEKEIKKARVEKPAESPAHPQPKPKPVPKSKPEPKPEPKPKPKPKRDQELKPKAKPVPRKEKSKPPKKEPPKPEPNRGALQQKPPKEKPHKDKHRDIRKPKDERPSQPQQMRKNGEQAPHKQTPHKQAAHKPAPPRPGDAPQKKDHHRPPQQPPHPPQPEKREQPKQKLRRDERPHNGHRNDKRQFPGKKHRYDKGRQAPPPPPPPPKPKPKPKVFDLPELIQTSNFVTLKELAEKLNLKLKDIEERMRSLNKEYLSNQVLDEGEIKEVCAAFKVEVDVVSYEEELFSNYIEKQNVQMTERAPVVTVMGHVDHGKTTLLDTLRNTRVADREAGGITQKIGAYKLSFKDHDIVFIDTPGHEAFTNIRARGARVTDVVVLIVAANDGVKPQTIEAINHARAADVPMVVAINKIDLDGADANVVKQQLTQHDLVVEDWGGDVVSVEISAKHNKNLDSLLEMISLVSEMLELKAYKDIPARGHIIESRLDQKLGPLGTVLLEHGKVKRGDFFICGDAVGKVKSIFDDSGKTLADAEVPMPVEIMGFENVPEDGQLFQVVDEIDRARKIVDLRKQRDKAAKKEDSFVDKKLSLQNLFEKLEEGKTKTFPVVIKTDNFSSVEVLEKLLLKQSQDDLKINIVQKAVGNITESDILLASTSGSILIGFNVKAPQKLMALAKREGVEIKLYNVIYHLIEDIEKAIKGEIAPEYVETYIGKAEVLQTFKISKIGIIAGCLVKEGKVTNKSSVKVLRNNDLVFEGELENLKRVKNDVSEVPAGTECGIRVKNFNAIEPGDVLEIYETKIKE